MPKRKTRPEPKTGGLTDRERGDIRLWLGWSAVLGFHFPTGLAAARDFLKAALKPDRRAEYMAYPRPYRKILIRAVIDEQNKRIENSSK